MCLPEHLRSWDLQAKDLEKEYNDKLTALKSAHTDRSTVLAIAAAEQDAEDTVCPLPPFTAYVVA